MVPVPNRSPKVWWSIGKRVLDAIGEKRLSLIAAGIAFFGILALFPAIAAIIALWGIVGDPQAILPVMERYSVLLAADESTLGWTTLLSIFLALWSARAGVAALMQGMNAVYEERNRGGLAHYLTAFGLTVELILVALVAISAVLLVPAIMALVPLGALATVAVEVGRWLVAVGILFLGAGLIYRYGPNRRAARLPWITPGAVLAVFLWAGASVAFSIYLTNFGNYNEVYGSIGAVIALLMWLFISGFLLLLGAALNAELERHTEPDSTIGRDRPLGERGAQAADTYVEI